MRHPDDPRWSHPSPQVDEEWLLTYSDMVTLLLAFFVMLASVSKVDLIQYEQIRAAMRHEIGRHDTRKPLKELKETLHQTIREVGAQNQIGIGVDDSGVMVEFLAAPYYTPGSADLRPEALPALRKVAETLQHPLYDGFRIEVQGHTDDVPVASPRYPSNWELSAARATAVVRLFTEAGIAPARLSAIAYADVMPKAPNRDRDGLPIAENQSLNRRIVVRIYPR
jgi:chemotaxis protein MotB